MRVSVRSLVAVAAVALAVAVGSAAGAAERRVARHLGPYPLTLAPPPLPPAVLPGQPLRLQLSPAYSGSAALAFSLDAGPAGMTVDAELGVIEWTPPAGAAGSSFDVGASVTDGTCSASVGFGVAVARTAPLAASLTGSTLTVTAAGSLHGVALTFPAGTAPVPAQVALAAVQGVTLPPLPEGARQVSGPFTATPVAVPDGAWITVTLPPSVLPAGSRPSDLCLYRWSEGDGEIGPRWVTQWNDLDVLPGGAVVMKVGALGGLWLVALAPPLPESTGAGELEPPEGTEVERALAIPCTRVAHSDGSVDDRRWSCTFEAPTNKVLVVFADWPEWSDGRALAVERAADVSLHLAACVSVLHRLYGPIVFPSLFSVVVEPLASGVAFAEARPEDQFRALRLDSGPRTVGEVRTGIARGALLCSAAMNDYAGYDNLVKSRTRRSDWIVEGLARWFEDLAYDSVDSYRWDIQPGDTFPSVLAAGLDAYPNPARPATSPAARSLFWMNLHRVCVSFNPFPFLLANLADDPTGVSRVERVLDSQGCGSAGFFPGEQGFGLARQLADYVYVTQAYPNGIAAIDAGAPALRFARPPTLTPSEPSAPGRYPAQAQTTVRLPGAAAAALWIAARPGLPTGSSVTLTFTPSGGLFGAWVSQPNLLPGGTSLVAATQPVTHTYDAAEAAVEHFAVVVNPSLADATTVDVLAAVARPGSFDVTDTFEDPLSVMKGCASWTATALGSVAGPAGAEMKAYANPYNPGHVRLEVTGQDITPPFRVTIGGTFDAAPNALTGTCTTASGSTIRWTYANKRVEWGNDDDDLETGSAFTWDMSGYSAAPFSRYREVDVVWDLTIQYLNADGSVKSQIVRNDRVLALLTASVELNTQ